MCVYDDEREDGELQTNHTTEKEKKKRRRRKKAHKPLSVSSTCKFLNFHFKKKNKDEKRKLLSNVSNENIIVSGKEKKRHSSF